MLDAVRNWAMEQGFDAIGVAPATSSEQAKLGLRAFLAAGFHGDMGWMESRADQRSDPSVLWPDARSAIVLGLNYAPPQDPLDGLQRQNAGNISVYARGDDYHDVLKKKLKAVARQVQKSFGGEIKVFVDTAPLMEKPLAQLSGLGWQGKHTNLVSREYGSWLFLGVILTTLELAPSQPGHDHCGTCNRCLDSCPTQAFPKPHQLDARRCISYLTIEHRGPIARELRPSMGNRIYGCDDCLAVCPWNKFAVASSATAAFTPRLTGGDLDLDQLARLTEETFRKLFRKSPIRRIGRDRFLRNVLIAIGNSGDPALAGRAEDLLKDISPMVRGAAVWALGRLRGLEELKMLREGLGANEADPDVLEEWDLAAPT